MQIRIISFTENGERLAEKLSGELAGEKENVICASARRNSPEYMPLQEWTQENFRQGYALIFIGACGIAVRSIAPFLHSKVTDPAVLVLDEKGQFVIPILSGHIGEANALAVQVAKITGGEPVLTTATDVNGLFAVDVFARENHLLIQDMKLAREFSASLLRTKKAVLGLPEGMKKTLVLNGNLPEEMDLRYLPEQESMREEKCRELSGRMEGAFVLISPEQPRKQILQLIPRCLVLGIGCRKGKSREELENFIRLVFQQQRLSLKAAAQIVSIDLKKEEAGICSLAEEWNIPFKTYTAEELNSVSGEFTASDFVRNRTGVDNVCERAVMAASAARLLVRKQAENGMTLAIGIQKEEFYVS